MIRLEYDTAGMRVSFVIRDGEMSMPISESLLWARTKGSGDTGAPQTANNLEIIQAMLDAAKAQVEKRRISGDLTPSGGDFLDE